MGCVAGASGVGGAGTELVRVVARVLRAWAVPLVEPVRWRAVSRRPRTTGYAVGYAVLQDQQRGRGTWLLDVLPLPGRAAGA
ncbi:hypothetical protein, partial [Devosia geojensis]|uniref:hypothetical protein n=1 Tax=Devosia geojensis TaxID=443610 RepID=UPI000A91F1BE